MKILTTLLISLITLNSFAQRVLVNASPQTTKLLLNGIPIANPNKITLENPLWVCIAMQNGYISQGINIGELKKKGVESYTFKLEKNLPLSPGYISKKILLEKLTDGTGKIEHGPISTPYGYISRLDLNEDKTLNALNKDLASFGYKSIVNNTMFEGKSDRPQLIIAGDVKHFSKGTRGSGFQVSILVDWFVFSLSEDKVVLELKDVAGYSASGLPFEEELRQTLSNSLSGLMNDPGFQKIANSTEEEKTVNKDKLSPIILPKFTYSKPASFSALVKSSSLSVVTIRTDLGFGSGFIISQNGYIITNEHVIHGAKKIEVIFSNGFQFDAEEVRTNKERDVSLIKISGKGYSPLTLNDNDDNSQIGTEVIAIGTPHDQNLTQSVTKGIISGKRTTDNLPYLQTDVAVNSGNSGGPLINTESGMVIGIVVSKIKAVGVEGISFAIPIEECKKALNILFE